MLSGVFPAIQGSTKLWETKEMAMRIALEQHNVVLRAALHQWRGYEVKTQGDSFGIETAAGRFEGWAKNQMGTRTSVLFV